MPAATMETYVVDHDISEDFTRIETFIPAESSIVLVCRKASILVLVRQENFDGILQPPLTNGLESSFLDTIRHDLRLSQAKDALQALARAITKRMMG
jgi:hypothetical protein